MSPLPRIGCYGELLLRLSPPGAERLAVAEQLEVHVGGAEANVGVALAQWGVPVEMHSRVPEGPIGERAIRHLRSFGVQTDTIARGGHRLGLYYYEAGQGPRGGQVVYDRAESSFATWADPIQASALRGLGLMHLTGISAAVASVAASRTLELVSRLRQAEVPLSLDLNYRSTLWQWGPPEPVMRPLAEAATVLIADQTSAQVMLGVEVSAAGDQPDTLYSALGAALAERAPRAKWIAFTHRSTDALGVDHYGGYAWLPREQRLVTSPAVPLHIIERIGGGDAFASGLLYGWLSKRDAADALRIGLAAAALKHTIPGDVIVATLDEVMDQLSSTGPRLKR